jgi:hypothetical protein
MAIALFALGLVIALGLMAAGLVLYFEDLFVAGPESQERPPDRS